MAGSLNRVQLIGNVGADPEIRSVNSGKVANFRIATSESWKDKNTGEKKERTEWHSIVVWNEGLVGVIQSYVKKGSKVMVEGQLQARKWEKDGVERYSTEVVLQGFGGSLLLLGDGGGGGSRSEGRSQDSGSQGGGSSSAGHQGSGAAMDDEIPFCMEWR